MATIVWRVDELAARRGWGARELAQEADLDEKTVRGILTGRASRVDLRTIARLAAALGVPPGALWRTAVDRSAAWRRTAGAAGRGTPAELTEVLAGAWSEVTDPAFERATRSPNPV